jgi:hypothetical protein
MNIFNAVALIEGRTEGSEEEVLEAWQYLVDTGVIHSLQGSLQRMASDFIEQGLISPQAD